MCKPAAILMTACSLMMIYQPVLQARQNGGPVKVFILAGQSNMQGQSVADLDGVHYNEGQGNLVSLGKDDQKKSLVKHLKNADGSWVVRDDVHVRYQLENGQLKAGPLSLGYTPYEGRHHFGPELQFGHVMGNSFEDPVLIIKTAWGGKSLYKDFRPPLSGGQVGPYYTKMITEIQQGLERTKAEWPEVSARGFELAGFVWYQGWNDGVDPKKAIPEYETNLVNLIRDVRRELKSPNLPVVVGELTGPWVVAPPEWARLREMQRAAASRPEFQGNTVFVETHNFVRPAAESPNPGHGHHEFGNAETGILVGNALAQGMLSLVQKKTRAEEPSAKPVAHEERMIEGWKVRLDSRLQEAENQEVARAALRFLENRLAEIKVVVPAEKVKLLQKVTIVLDLSHGDLKSMQYHPGAEWLKANGYSEKLAKCVHLPRAADLATKRNINEQPWVILHELAHAYHDQFLDFENTKIKAVFEQFKKSGLGDKTLLFNGKRVKHYALTNQMEFFAEMTEAFFGVNDFYPFNRAELMETAPWMMEMLQEAWGLR